jgi:hypothetical protein
LEIKNKNSGEVQEEHFPWHLRGSKERCRNTPGVEGGVTPLAASMDQKSATANSATVMPVKYKRATSFPIFIILLLVKASPLPMPHLVKKL